MWKKYADCLALGVEGRAKSAQRHHILFEVQCDPCQVFALNSAFDAFLVPSVYQKGDRTPTNTITSSKPARRQPFPDLESMALSVPVQGPR
jgi:hypothetical protein